jgi:tetratricopeptide (TPR) repeat protein
MQRAGMVMAVVWVAAAGAADGPEAWITAGHWKRARAVVEARLRANPEDAEANYLGSMIRAAFGDRQAPMKLAEKAVARDPGVARYHRQLAEVIGVTAQHSNAFEQVFLARRFRKEIDAALALDARDPQALRDLLEYYLLAPGIVGGDKAKARETARRVAAVDATAGFSAEARIASFSGEGERAIAMLRRAVEGATASYGARMELAQAYWSGAQRNAVGAESEAKEAVRIDPGRAGGYRLLGEMYASQGRWEELEAMLATARRLVPDDLSPLYYAAIGASGAQERSRAEGYLKEYLGSEPEGNAPSAAEARARLAGLSGGRKRATR